jgi:hypothetical protein
VKKQIDYRRRIIEHPAWLIMLPSMRVDVDDSGRHQRLQSCLNIVAPRDPEVIRKLLDITSQCVACGADMHPLATQNNDDLSLDFTCGKKRCRENKIVNEEILLLQNTLLRTQSPDQTSVF